AAEHGAVDDVDHFGKGEALDIVFFLDLNAYRAHPGHGAHQTPRLGFLDGPVRSALADPHGPGHLPHRNLAAQGQLFNVFQELLMLGSQELTAFKTGYTNHTTPECSLRALFFPAAARRASFKLRASFSRLLAASYLYQ